MVPGRFIWIVEWLIFTILRCQWVSSVQVDGALDAGDHVPSPADNCEVICNGFQEQLTEEECKRGCRSYFSISAESEESAESSQSDCNRFCLLTYTNETRQSTCHWGCAMANKEFRNSNEINAKKAVHVHWYDLNQAYIEFTSSVVFPHRAKDIESGSFIGQKKKYPPGATVNDSPSVEKHLPRRVYETVGSGSGHAEQVSSSVNFYLITLIMCSSTLMIIASYFLLTRRQRWLKRQLENEQVFVQDWNMQNGDEESLPPSYEIAVKLAMLPDYNSVILADADNPQSIINLSNGTPS